jgi:hypothetical protein
VVALSEPVSSVPLVATCPPHPPEAVHDVEFSELHVRTDVPPGATTDGLAVSVATGTVTTWTVAVAAWLLPPAPVQVSEKVVAELRAADAWEPEVASVPLQPPDAVQVVESVELQVNVEVVPGATDVGLAARVAVGIICIVVVVGWLVPPGPVHVNVKSVTAFSAPVLLLPLEANEPLQPPEAVQEVAFVELQVSVVSSP